MKPVVSVIIPAYNASLYLDDAIRSVLAQEVSLEIIVVDDCSNDDTEQIIDKYLALDGFTYIKNKTNVGVAKARNIGVKRAVGDYIAYLDADDWWNQKKLQKQLEILTTNNAVMCFTARELVEEDAKSIRKVIHVPQRIEYKKLFFHNCISCSSVLLKRDVALEFPMEDSSVHEDYLNWLRILSKYRVAYAIDEPLIVYRLSKGGKSRNKIKSIKMTYGVYRKLKINKVMSFIYLISHLVHGVIKYQ